MNENVIHKRTMKDIRNFYNNANKMNMHKQILDKMHELYVSKNKDYGDSVSKTYKKYGLTSFLVRMEDKLNRVETLIKNEESKVKDEKIEDTLLDLANYSILAIIELKSNDNAKTTNNMSDYVLKKDLKCILDKYGKVPADDFDSNIDFYTEIKQLLEDK